MAYREVGMIAVREILRRWQAGAGFRALARAVRVDRATVAAYVRLAGEGGVERGGVPPTDADIAAILAGRRPGWPTASETPSPELAALTPLEATIRRWLLEDAPPLTKVHRRLRDQGVRVSYSTLYRFARHHCGFSPAAVTVRVAESPPGELAEVDFGTLGLWTDAAQGQRRRIHGLLVTLPTVGTRFCGSRSGKTSPPSSTGSRRPGPSSAACPGGLPSTASSPPSSRVTSTMSSWSGTAGPPRSSKL